MKTAFEAGYAAYCAHLPLDPSQPQEWQNGWHHAAATEEAILSTG